MSDKDQELLGTMFTVKSFADDVPLIGPDAPKLEKVTDVVRYFMTVYQRFGDTSVTINASWGSSSLHARDRLTSELTTALEEQAS